MKNGPCQGNGLPGIGRFVSCMDVYGRVYFVARKCVFLLAKMSTLFYPSQLDIRKLPVPIDTIIACANLGSTLNKPHKVPLEYTENVR